MINGSNWLSHCPANTKIGNLLIPGTHDTMTAPCRENYYRTQTLTLQEQLEAGVRFLDIRLRRSMVAAHREWLSDVDFPRILKICKDFLVSNPGEFILMRLQNANENKDDFELYGPALQEEIAKELDLFYHWAKPNTWPTIGEAKGKILAFESSPVEYEFGKIGDIQWATNWHFNEYIFLQDLWNGPSLEAKKSAISNHLVHSAKLNENTISLNHISATNGLIGNPLGYAELLNPYSLRLLKELHDLRGVLIYDYITPEISEALYKYNLIK